MKTKGSAEKPSSAWKFLRASVYYTAVVAVAVLAVQALQHLYMLAWADWRVAAGLIIVFAVTAIVVSCPDFRKKICNACPYGWCLLKKLSLC